MINSQSALPGEQVTFTVMIGPGPNDVEAFGFEVRYNSMVLKYIGNSKGAITNKFNEVLVNDPSDGVIRMAGIGIPPVRIDKKTDLLYLDFICLECTEKNTFLEIIRKSDDVAKWESIPGIFACLSQEKEEESETSASTQQQGGAETREKKVIELTNKGTSTVPQQQQQISNIYFPAASQKHPSNPIPDNQGVSGGGGGWGSASESFDTSGLSAVYGHIPSVTNTIPASGSTGITGSQSIRIVFNQSMDHLKVENAFIIDPHVEGQINWENYLKEMVFIPYMPLAPETIYNVYLTEDAADIYGRLLDGDRDGAMGGEFCFSFQTSEKVHMDQKTEPITIPPTVKRCFIMCVLYDNMECRYRLDEDGLI